MGGTDRSIARRRALLLLLAVMAGCGFPRPPDVGDDTPAPVGCSRDPDCTSPRPFCVEATCAACRDSTSCPAARPVCDMVSHDCRTCAQDRECDSGACDLAAGRCVDQGAILYASPGGTNADPCTRTSPCSLSRAAELVDLNHAYIVLEAGEYTSAAQFKSQKATIVGNSATIASDAVISKIFISGQSSLNIRDIRIEEHATGSNDSPQPIISSIDMSEVTIDNMKSNTLTAYAVQGDIITARHSSFMGSSLSASRRLVIDTCQFQNKGPVVRGSIELTNSVIITTRSMRAIDANSADPDHLASKILNNTFIRGTVFCNPSTDNPFVTLLFKNNIFYDLDTSPASTSKCIYQYNLTAPTMTPAGIGNTMGDPMFVDMNNHDFHPRPGSAAIDAADPSDTSIARDFDGTHRPQGTRSDIGAFEYVPPR